MKAKQNNWEADLTPLFAICDDDHASKIINDLDWFIRTNANTPLEKLLKKRDDLGNLRNQVALSQICADLKTHLKFSSTASVRIPQEMEINFGRWEKRCFNVTIEQELRYTYEEEFVKSHGRFQASFKDALNRVDEAKVAFHDQSNAIRCTCDNFVQLRKKDAKRKDRDLEWDKIQNSLIPYSECQIKILKYLDEANSILTEYNKKRNEWANFLMGVKRTMRLNSV